jgi:hypothetical protein
MEIKITLTEAEAKAMSYIAYSPEEWATNVVKERARLAMEEIFQLEVDRMLADPNITDIPANQEQVVLQAEIKTAKERTDEILASDTIVE